MEKELKIQRFKATQEMLAGLENDEFSFDNFVTSFNDNCGTVCCALGWYPKYFPASKLTWYKKASGKVTIGTTARIQEKTSLYHGVDKEVIARIFFIDYKSESGFFGDSYQNYLEVTRQDVINRIQEYIDKIEAGEEV